MKLTIMGDGVAITPALRKHAEKKFHIILKVGDKITSVKLILTVDNLKKIAEATVFGLGTEVFARSEMDDMYVAIKDLVHKLERQILKIKAKSRSRAQV